MENVEFNIEASYSGATDIEQFLRDLDTLGNRLKNVGSTGTGIAKAEQGIRRLDKAVKDSSRGQKAAREDAILLNAAYKEGLLVLKKRTAAEKAAEVARRQRIVNSPENFQQRAAALSKEQTQSETRRAAASRRAAKAARLENDSYQKRVGIIRKIAQEQIALRRQQRATAREALGRTIAPAIARTTLNEAATRLTAEEKISAQKKAQADFAARQLALNERLTQANTRRRSRFTEREGDPQTPRLFQRRDVRAGRQLEGTTSRLSQNISKFRDGVRNSIGKFETLGERSRDLSRNIRTTTGRMRLFNGTVARSIISVTALAALFGTFRAISLGVGFADQLDRADNQIAGIISSVSGLVDINGEAVSTATAYADSIGLARDQVQKLKGDALETASTFDQLLENFQLAIGPGLSAGLDLDEVRELTVDISQAATAFGIAQDQLAEEVRSLFTGAINPRNSRIATILQITPEDVRSARQSGQLFDLLSTKLAGVGLAAKDLRSTLQLVFSNLADLLLQVSGTAFEPFRQNLLKLGATLGTAFSGQGAGVAVLAQLGSFLADATKGLNEFIKGLDPGTIARFFEGIRNLATAFVTTAASVAEVLTPALSGLSNLLGDIGAALTRLQEDPSARFFIGLAGAVGLAVPLVLTLTGALTLMWAALVKIALILPAATGGFSLLAGAAIAAGLAIFGFTAYNSSFEDSASSATDSTKALTKALKDADSAAGPSSSSFLKAPIEGAKELQEQLQEASKDLETFARKTRRDLARVGVDANFADFTSGLLDLKEVPTNQIGELTSQLEASAEAGNEARASLQGLRDEASRLGALEAIASRQRDNFSPSGSRGADFLEFQALLDYQKQREDAVKRVADAEKVINDSNEDRLRITSLIASKEKDIAKQKAAQAAAQDRRLQVAFQLVAREQAANQASLAVQEKISRLKLGAGDLTGDLQGQADLEDQVRLIEDAERLRTQNLTVSSLQRRAEKLTNDERRIAAFLTGVISSFAQKGFTLSNKVLLLERDLADLARDRLIAEKKIADEKERNLLIADAELEKLEGADFASRNDGNLQDEIANQEKRVQIFKNLSNEARIAFEDAKKTTNNQELLNGLKREQLGLESRLRQEQEAKVELQEQERREGTLGGGFEAGLQNQERRRGQIAEDFTGESFGILRSSLSQAVAIAFDPNQNLDLGAGIKYIGLQIGQALANALLEQIVVQPIVSGIQGLFGLAAANSGGAVRPGGILPSYASGGTVGSPNLTRAPRGAHPKDKVLAALTPGEGVLNVGAMQALGTDWLHKMNRNFGSIRVGTHIKKKLRDQGIPGFNSGGPVGTGRQRTLGRRPTVGSQSQVVLVADRERSRQILRGRAFDERTIKSARTINALRP